MYLTLGTLDDYFSHLDALAPASVFSNPRSSILRACQRPQTPLPHWTLPDGRLMCEVRALRVWTTISVLLLCSVAAVPQVADGSNSGELHLPSRVHGRQLTATVSPLPAFLAWIWATDTLISGMDMVPRRASPGYRRPLCRQVRLSRQIAPPASAANLTTPPISPLQEDKEVRDLFRAWKRKNGKAYGDKEVRRRRLGSVRHVVDGQCAQLARCQPSAHPTPPCPSAAERGAFRNLSRQPGESSCPQLPARQSFPAGPGPL